MCYLQKYNQGLSQLLNGVLGPPRGLKALDLKGDAPAQRALLGSKPMIFWGDMKDFNTLSAQWSEVYAVLTDGKKNQAGISKKSNVLSLRCKKVCRKRK